jgi:hypothetical protein
MIPDTVCGDQRGDGGDLDRTVGAEATAWAESA